MIKIILINNKYFSQIQYYCTHLLLSCTIKILYH